MKIKVNKSPLLPGEQIIFEGSLWTEYTGEFVIEITNLIGLYVEWATQYLSTPNNLTGWLSRTSDEYAMLLALFAHTTFQSDFIFLATLADMFGVPNVGKAYYDPLLEKVFLLKYLGLIDPEFSNQLRIVLERGTSAIKGSNNEV